MAITAELLLLGFVAGFTIFFGLPIALMPEKKKFKGILNSVATGVLIFLLVEVIHDSVELVENSTIAASSGSSSVMAAVSSSAILVIGLVIGLLGLVLFELKFLRSRESRSLGLGKAKYLALMIATGIGLHNFSEGLAIGQSYVSGAIHLALLLAVGFGLHNMTEGFGIAGPLHGFKPTWKFLLLLGIIGGGPTFLGAVIGSIYSSSALSLLFLSLAGGAIIYVIKELLYHGRIEGEDFLMMSGLLIGFFLGFGAEIALKLFGG